MHPGKDDDVRIRCSSLLKAQAVADVVGNILNIRLLIVVRQNDGVLLF